MPKEVKQIMSDIRKETGLSLTEVTMKTGLMPQQISNYEKGQRGISLQKYLAYCEKLGIDPAKHIK